ncbi:MAG: GMC family oxidoreductase [Leptospiraceae bacterium]|nr:GMC family oxidoreductase [Leptospiraceae bacterium]
MDNTQFDYDYIIVGSGFGGSVSAMRLSQKGYKVLVIESGKRWNPGDYPKSNLNLRKFVWLPKIFCYGIQRLDLLNDVMILSGAGVGGGSLVYANTLYVPPKKVFESDIVKKMGGEEEILPFYEIAKKMLGVVTNPRLWQVDEYMKQTAAHFGMEDTFKPTPVGVNFSEENGVDPYFNGEGPERNGCNYCGACMVGCRFNAKNTLDKNYLYFAEKLGATILPESKVVDMIPLGENGKDGYKIHTKSTTGMFGSPKHSFTTKGVVLSAGVLGTMELLMKLRDKGRMPNLSPLLGQTVRTNSESIVGVTALDKKTDFSKGIAITSSVYPDEDTHIEPVRYPDGSDAMATLAAGDLIDGGGKVPRQFRFLWSLIRHPFRSIRFAIPFGFAKRSIILLVMQALDNSIEIVRKRRWFWPFSKTLGSKQKPGELIPTYIPIANQFARKLGENINGVARSSLNEVILNIPTTAHILGGSIIGENPQEGVIDLQNRVFGYENLRVCDGSMVPVNLGVNPSLTITAFTERAMSFILPKNAESEQQFFEYEKTWNITGVLKRDKANSEVKVEKSVLSLIKDMKTELEIVSSGSENKNKSKENKPKVVKKTISKKKSVISKKKTISKKKSISKKKPVGKSKTSKKKSKSNK